MGSDFHVSVPHFVTFYAAQNHVSQRHFPTIHFRDLFRSMKYKLRLVISTEHRIQRRYLKSLRVTNFLLS
jgi:hypothetical protein